VGDAPPCIGNECEKNSTRSLSLAHSAAHIGEAAEYTSCVCVLTAAGQTLCFLAAANAPGEKFKTRNICTLGSGALRVHAPPRQKVSPQIN
jgi:hypothetical protein